MPTHPLMSPQRPTTPASQRELDRSLSPVSQNRGTKRRRRNAAALRVASHFASFAVGALALASSLALLPAPPPAPSSAPPSSSLLSRALDGLCEIPRRRFLEARSGPNYLEAIDDAAAALPPSVHATLLFSSDDNNNDNVGVESRAKPSKLLGQGRLVFVGDVHGCADELGELLFDKVRFDASRDTLVLLGDVVSKGTDSPRALRIARGLGAWSVRGNHDDAALAAYDHYKRTGLVPRVSRVDTGGEDYSFVKELSRADANYLRDMPWTLDIPSHGAVAVHAGLVPGVSVNRQKLSDVFMMRGVVEVDGGGGGGSGGGRRGEFVESKKPRTTKTYRATTTPGEGMPWARVWSIPSPESLNRRKHVVFGHDSRSGLQREALATGIDTGCVDGGELTALVLRRPGSSPSFAAERGGSRWPTKGVELVSVKCRGVKEREGREREKRNL